MQRHLTLILLTTFFCMAARAADQSPAVQPAFDREAALGKYKDVCQREFALAIGSGMKKRNGMTREAHIKEIEDNDVASSETKATLLEIAEEMYAVPDLREKTYVFYRLESCLVHEWIGGERPEFSAVVDQVLACDAEDFADDLSGLIPCIDAALIATSVDRSQQASTE